MTPQAFHQQVLGRCPGVVVAEQFGYTFYLVAEGEPMPFATVATSDNDYDRVSDLDREGVHRINLGVSRETYRTLFPRDTQEVDHTRLDVFLPHPHYAAQHFLCILNPGPENAERVLEMLDEAYAIAKRRAERKQP